jgi:ketosteroid isomerase-like protein
MQWITVATPVFGSIEEFDKVHDRLLAQRGGEHEGLEARYVGTAEDGKPRVVALWESKSHADRFFGERLGSARAKALGPDVGVPEIVGVAVERSYRRRAQVVDTATVDVVRRFYAAVAERDLHAAGACFAEDAVWTLPGQSSIAGAHRGWTAIRDDFLAQLGVSPEKADRARWSCRMEHKATARRRVVLRARYTDLPMRRRRYGSFIRYRPLLVPRTVRRNRRSIEPDERGGPPWRHRRSSRRSTPDDPIQCGPSARWWT